MPDLRDRSYLRLGMEVEDKQSKNHSSESENWCHALFSRLDQITLPIRIVCVQYEFPGAPSRANTERSMSRVIHRDDLKAKGPGFSRTFRRH